MTYPFALTFVACVVLLTFSQTPSSSSAVSRCSLTPEQAPELRGIRLRMSPEQLLALFPEDRNQQAITQAIKESKRTDKYGFGRFDLRPDRETANPRFEGINYIAVDLLDERVTSFHIAYVGPEWNTADQFVAKLSDALRLPSSSWERSDDTRQSLKCDGFRVEAYAFSAQSWVRVHDTSAPRVVEDRREAVKEKKRQAFKP